MELRIGIAKTAKYTIDDSCETIDVIERPDGGGYSVILCDGMAAGVPSKTVSAFVANKISSLILEGVRDSTAIRATSDQLFTSYTGMAQALLNIISIDLKTDTIVVSRNNPYPVYFYLHDIMMDWSNDSRPIGGSKHIQPAISEIPLEPGSLIVLLTDGVFLSGKAFGDEIDVPILIHSIMEDCNHPSSQEIADFILNHAIQLDQGKPQNDMCVMAMQILNGSESTIRRASYVLPFEENR